MKIKRLFQGCKTRDDLKHLALTQHYAKRDQGYRIGKQDIQYIIYQEKYTI